MIQLNGKKNCLVVETFAQKLFNGKGAHVWAIASPGKLMTLVFLSSLWVMVT